MPFGNLTIDDTQSLKITPIVSVATVTNPIVSTALAGQDIVDNSSEDTWRESKGAASPEPEPDVEAGGATSISVSTIPPTSISESLHRWGIEDGAWTFTVDYNKHTNKFAGCGPIDSSGQTVAWGVCVVYDWNNNEQFIRKALQKVMEVGSETVANQEQYAQEESTWKAAKQQCESQSEEGYTFGYVHEDGTPYYRSRTDASAWSCVRTKVVATGTSGRGGASGGVSQEDEETLDEEEDETHVAGGSIELGFSEGMKETLKNGLILFVVVGIGYGVYQTEKKTDLFSNTYKKLTTKLKKSKTTKKPAPSQQT